MAQPLSNWERVGKCQTMERTYKYRLLPTSKQRIVLLNALDACRWLHNACLEQRIIGWRSHHRTITYVEQSRELPGIMATLPQFKSVPHHVLQRAMRRLDRAYTAFFRSVKKRRMGGATPKVGFPRFKSRDRYRSLEFDTTAFHIDRDQAVLSKVGRIRFIEHRPIPKEGRVVLATVKCDAVGDWWVSFAMDLPEPVERPIVRVLGVDLGLHSLIATSDGQTVDAPRCLRRNLSKLRCEQRRLSRRIKGSKNRQRQRMVVARLHRKVGYQRSDFLHKLSRQLVDACDAVVFEDLRIKNMQRNPRLSLSIADAGWNELVRMTTYKAEGAGGKVVRVNPAGTSQECSGCGANVPKSLSTRVHRCACGLVLDRDVNAARNILTRGLGELHGLATVGAKRARASRVPREPRESTPVETGPPRRLCAAASPVDDAGSHLL